MAIDLPSSVVPGVWPVLHDDDHLSNHRRIKNGTAPFACSAGTLLCTLHSAFSPELRCGGHLPGTARRRCANGSGVPAFDKTHEADSLNDDGGAYKRYRLRGKGRAPAIGDKKRRKVCVVLWKFDTAPAEKDFRLRSNKNSRKAVFGVRWAVPVPWSWRSVFLLRSHKKQRLLWQIQTRKGADSLL